MLFKELCCTLALSLADALDPPFEYRINVTTLPQVLCLGDSIGGPSCNAAISDPRLKGKLELHSIYSFASSNDTQLHNSMGARNLHKCVDDWLIGRCLPGETRPPCPKPQLRWRSVVLGAGAWDLFSRPCCIMNEERIAQLVGDVRNTVNLALRHAETAVWMTTTPAPEHAGCCRDPTRNYSGRAHLYNTSNYGGSIGYCHHDAIEQNARVAAMLKASFSTNRVAIADTYSAVTRRCGTQYRDCAVQPQFDVLGRAHVCQVHFTGSSFGEVHGPAVARALAGLLGL